MKIIYRFILRINRILNKQNKQIKEFLQVIHLSTIDVDNFLNNKYNEKFFQQIIFYSRLLQIHQGIFLQYFFEYFSRKNKCYVEPEPMFDMLKIDSECLPYVDNINKKIILIIIKKIYYQFNKKAQLLLILKILNNLEYSAFVFFNDELFNNIKTQYGNLYDNI